MEDELRDLKRILSIVAIAIILVFVGFLALETAVLVYKAPYISESIMSGELGPGSDIILPEEDVNTSEGLRLSISPQVNGTISEVGGYCIFTPESPLDVGKRYTLSYGYGNSMGFHVDNASLKAEPIDTEQGQILVAFNHDVIREDAESLISFSPSITYDTEWYGNTLIIEPHSSMDETCTFTMSGAVNTTDGSNGTIDIELTYSYYFTDTGTNQMPHFPSTVVFIMLPPGLIVGTNTLQGISYLRYFQFILITILASVGYGVYVDRKAFVKALTEGIGEQNLKVPSDSVFLEIGALLMATISFSLISYYIVYMTNHNPTVPSMGENPLWENMYSLARAGVWEELVTRIPFIGLPMLLVHYLMKRKRAPIWRYFLGGGFEMDGVSIFFLFMSSLFFGLAHAFGGWDFFKVLPAMVGGLAMGYLFLKRGLYASIILHFANDYMSIPSEVFASDSMDMFTGVLVMAMVGIGVFTFYLYLKAFLVKFIFPPRVPADKAETLGSGGLYGSSGHPENTSRYPYGAQYPPNSYPYNQPAQQYQQAQWQYGNQYYNPYNQSYPQRSAGNIEVSPTGYIKYVPHTAPVSQEMPFAPYPFKCLICGGRTAVFQDDGTVLCGSCGMRYALRKNPVESAPQAPQEAEPMEQPHSEEKEGLEEDKKEDSGQGPGPMV